ncbi:hypothetical protein FS837_004959 [Tulasnella sp. UAMH 9824]|nr:hypothetical protein FS837_004959 [Tulasnella sp. UAMH 9824]
MHAFSAFAALATLAAATFTNAAPASSGRERLYARSLVTGHDIEARFEFWGRTDGTGTFVKVEVLKGLTVNKGDFHGPYGYHIHTNPVGKERDCAKALAHLDPLEVTESLICDPAFPEYCQEGDLSGKHGKFNGTTTGAIETFGYTDDYLRFFPEDLSILGRSIVIHASNKTRLACGDIISTLDGTATGSFKPTYKPSKFVKHYPTVAPTNPPQVVTPFVGTEFPSDDTLHNLPFPLANPAIPLSEALNVKLVRQTQTVWVNGSQTQVELPIEKKSSAKPPFHGFQDKTWTWVKDLAKSVKWYMEVLGFHGGEIDGTISSIARGTKAEMNVYLFQADEENPVRRAELVLMVEPELPEHQNEVGPGLALKAWWDQIKDTVKVTAPLERKPWGWYMFNIEDPDAFFQHGPDEEEQ